MIRAIGEKFRIMISATVWSSSNMGYTFSVQQKSFVPPNSFTNLKPITKRHIEKSETLAELLIGVDFYGIHDKQFFQDFLKKLTRLFSRTNDPQVIFWIERMIHHMRRLSSAETSAKTSDLLNYELLFRKIMKAYPNQYRFEGFEIRTSMIAETIPKLLTFEGKEPKSAALLHYMTTYTGLSKLQMKKHILSYIMRYFINKNSLTALRTRKTKVSMAYSQTEIDVDTLSIILSCSSVRNTKNNMESSLDEVAILNLNKFWWFAKKVFGVERVLQKKYVCVVEGQEMPIMNSYDNFLKTVDLYVTLLKYQMKNTYKSQFSFLNPIRDLSIFVEEVFFNAKDMKIFLNLTNSSSHQSKFQEENQTNFKRSEVKQVNLWKVASQVMQGLSHDSKFVENRAKIVKKIVCEVLKLNRYEKQERFSIYERYAPELLNTLINTPVKVLTDMLQSSIITQQQIEQLLLEISKKLPQTQKFREDQTDRSKETRKKMIKLYEMKSKLLLSQGSWFEIFKNIACQDSNRQFWELYFFFAQEMKLNKNQNFAQIIPLESLVKKVNKLRQILVLEDIIGEEDFYRKMILKQIKKADENKEFIEECLKKKNSYEIELLKLYSLSLMLEKDESKLFEKSQIDFNSMKKKGQIFKQQLTFGLETQEKINLSQNQFQKIFTNWVSPFSFSLYLANENQDPGYSSLETFKFKPFQTINEPFAFLEKLYEKVIKETSSFYNFKFLQKIITHPKFENQMLVSHFKSSMNFHAYLKVLLLGLGDTKNSEKYLKKFVIKKIIPKDFRISSIIGSISNTIPSKLINSNQWAFMLKIFQQLNSIFQIKDSFNLFLSQQKRNKLIFFSPSENFQRVSKKDNLEGILKQIVNSLFIDAQSQKNFTEIKMRKYSYLVNIFFEMFENYPQFSVCQRKFELPNVFIDSKIKYQKQIYLSFIKLDLMGVLDKKTTKNLLDSVKFANQFDLGLMLFENILEVKHSEEEQQEIIKNIFKISSIKKTQISAIFISIRYMKPDIYHKMIQIIKKINVPENRITLLREVIKIKQKYQIHDPNQQLEKEIQRTEKEIQDYQQFIEVDHVQQNYEDQIDQEQLFDAEGFNEEIQKGFFPHEENENKTQNSGILEKIKEKAHDKKEQITLMKDNSAPVKKQAGFFKK